MFHFTRIFLLVVLLLHQHYRLTLGGDSSMFATVSFVAINIAPVRKVVKRRYDNTRDDEGSHFFVSAFSKWTLILVTTRKRIVRICSLSTMRSISPQREIHLTLNHALLRSSSMMKKYRLHSISKGRITIKGILFSNRNSHDSKYKVLN